MELGFAKQEEWKEEILGGNGAGAPYSGCFDNRLEHGLVTQMFQCL